MLEFLRWSMFGKELFGDKGVLGCSSWIYTSHENTIPIDIQYFHNFYGQNYKLEQNCQCSEILSLSNISVSGFFRFEFCLCSDFF